MANVTQDCSDASFGPAASCDGTFDFTLLFEQSILSIGPSALLLLFLPFQLRILWRATRKTVPSKVLALKATTSAALIGLQLALVVFWSKDDIVKTAIPYAVVYLVVTVAVSVLALLGHDRSLAPSSLLSIFLLIFVLFDAVQVRTLFLRGPSTAIAGVLSTAMALKLVLLVLEVRSKCGYLKEPYSRFPLENLSGILNRSFFWWLHPTFLQGYRTTITLDSLCDIDIALASEPVQSRILHGWGKYKGKGRYSLVFALVSTLRWPFLAVVFPRLCLVAFNYAQPFLIERAVSLLKETVDEKTTNYGYGLIAATALVYLGIAVSTSLYQYKLCRSLAMVRAATISLIYVTSLEAPAGDHDEAKTVTLMSTDVDRAVSGLELIHETWARLLEIAIGIWLLERQMGAVSIAPILVAIMCFAWQTWLARYIGPKQLPWIKAIQSRVGKTSSVLRDMKAVKMLGLEELIVDLLQTQRIRELQLSKQFRWMIVWINIVASMPQILAPLVTFTVYAIRSQVENGDGLSTVKAFTSLAIISLITNPTVNFLASIPALRVAEGCLDRIQTFLLTRNISGNNEHASQTLLDCESTENGFEHEMAAMEQTPRPKQGGLLVKLEDIDLRLAKDAELILQGVNLRIFAAQLTIVIGPVGSGKSTLLKALLGEITLERGSHSVLTKSVGYCSQIPWLPNGSIRDVLCCTAPYEATWYNTVIHACDLEDVIQQLPQGDASIIGSRGSVLSGGQRQRLALARAIYARTELLLLDDIFSALDRETEQKIAKRLFSEDGLLRKLHCTVILVTDAVRHASMADNIIVIDPNSKTAKSHSLDEFATLNDLPLPPQSVESEMEGDDGAANSNTPMSNKPKNAIKGASQEDLEDLARRTGDTSVYLYYYRCIGLWRTLLAVIILVVFTFASNYPRFWIQWYTEDPIPRYRLFIGVYVMLVLVASISQGAMIWQIMINIVPKSGTELHRILLRTVMHAPMHFFWTVDFGVTLNRFSQDMTLVDAVLPTAAFGTILAALQCVAQLIFISLGSSYMAICIPVTIIALYFIQRVYLRTSRQLRFLELEAKSPLFTHFVETTEGLVSIRAFDWRANFIKTNLRHLDRSQKPFYLLLCIQRWLTLVLDLMVAAIATALVALAFSLRSTTSGGSLGVALTAVLSFSQALQGLLLSWTQMETSLGAIARTKTLESAILPEDVDDEVREPRPDWPSEGAMEFRNVSASYNGENMALRDVSFLVKSKQKIGIIGRTGSGKSTLISVLLRLVNIASAGNVEGMAASPANIGQIIIDGLSVATIPRTTLRSRILSIPQESLTLPGTFRFNANPFQAKISSDSESGSIDDNSRDDLIIYSLRKVGLWELIKARGGLDANMTSESLSQGETQLFAIARTIIQKDLANSDPTGAAQVRTPSAYKLLLLDEATSHLDVETDTKIQALIRQEFLDFTIIVVAHRIGSIVDSDMVGIMDNGRMVQFGHPDKVLDGY